MSNYNKRRVLNLLKKTKNCHWCGCIVVKHHLKNPNALPKNYATLDHLYHRLHPERGLHQGKETTVLACHGCNKKRNDEFFKSLPDELKKLYATRIPVFEEIIVTRSNVILYKEKDFK